MFFALHVFYFKTVHSSFLAHTPNQAKVMPTVTDRACDLRGLKPRQFVSHLRRVRSEAEALLCAVKSFRHVEPAGRGDTAWTSLSPANAPPTASPRPNSAPDRAELQKRWRSVALPCPREEVDMGFAGR